MSLFFWRTRQQDWTQDGADPARDEAALIAKAQKGDRRAFDRLAYTHVAPLRGFLARRVAADALDDVVQETLLAAWSGLPRFVPRGIPFKTWLYRIALHKAADWGRAHERHAAREAALTDAERDRAGSDEDTPYVLTERRDTVRAVLARLPADQREVVELYYYAELTLNDIARLLGRNLSTVKYQFYRAHAVAAEVVAAPERGETHGAGETAPGRPARPNRRRDAASPAVAAAGATHPGVALKP